MRWVMNQAIHFVAAIVIFMLFAFGGLVGAALAGCGLGIIREFSEVGGSRIEFHEVVGHFKRLDPWSDLAFWSLGGYVAALLITSLG
ncbi:hypothetical protein [Erythrobacter rubeus]|uniref:Uncharacterized protein n=1 Tax=Erythrobacter rubeus TaxID=2760803 RepID=A0ABR8KX30_9SPHN|nr:hypothetical protein [Erythrobacter rubeus]MBD2842716.1 hypothetical protein [Erythrobacter rubeus]